LQTQCLADPRKRPKKQPGPDTSRTTAYLQAAQAAGGADGIAGYLYDQAMKDNPSPFMTGLAKLLPLMLEGNKDAPIIVERVYYTGKTDGDAN
jgi:hypothetical protein